MRFGVHPVIEDNLVDPDKVKELLKLTKELSERVTELEGWTPSKDDREKYVDQLCACLWLQVDRVGRRELDQRTLIICGRSIVYAEKERQEALIESCNLLCEYVDGKLPDGWTIELSMSSFECSLFPSYGT